MDAIEQAIQHFGTAADASSKALESFRAAQRETVALRRELDHWKGDSARTGEALRREREARAAIEAVGQRALEAEKATAAETIERLRKDLAAATERAAQLAQRENEALQREAGLRGEVATLTAVLADQGAKTARQEMADATALADQERATPVA